MRQHVEHVSKLMRILQIKNSFYLQVNTCASVVYKLIIIYHFLVLGVRHMMIVRV